VSEFVADPVDIHFLLEQRCYIRIRHCLIWINARRALHEPAAGLTVEKW